MNYPDLFRHLSYVGVALLVALFLFPLHITWLTGEVGEEWPHVLTMYPVWKQSSSVLWDTTLLAGAVVLCAIIGLRVIAYATDQMRGETHDTPQESLGRNRNETYGMPQESLGGKVRDLQRTRPEHTS